MNKYPLAAAIFFFVLSGVVGYFGLSVLCPILAAAGGFYAGWGVWAEDKEASG